MHTFKSTMFSPQKVHLSSYSATVCMHKMSVLTTVFVKKKRGSIFSLLRLLGRTISLWIIKKSAKNACCLITSYIKSHERKAE